MNSRKLAIAKIAERKVECSDNTPQYEIDKEYGKDVFGIRAMEQYLPRPAYKKLVETINAGTPIDSSIANDVAHAMKKWAMERGVTHYTHWFLPLNGLSAEKHDSFLTRAGKSATPSRAFQVKT